MEMAFCVFCLDQEGRDRIGLEPHQPRYKYQAWKSRDQKLGRIRNRAAIAERFGIHKGSDN